MNVKEKNITQMIKAKVLQKDPLADVILFGSHARGQAKIDSDWDILVLTHTPKTNRLTEKEYRDELYDIELEIGEPISTMVFSKKEWNEKHFVTPFYQNIKREGIYL